jgi:hypothetical protein
VLSGCVGEAPPKDIAAPDIAKIALFYPVDNLVPGRGEVETFGDSSVSYVYVASHPTGTDDAFPVEEDGSFTFSILGVSGDVIEIAGARDDKGLTRGESVYFRVPPLPPQGSRFFCCQDTGVCTAEEDYERNNRVCPERDTLSVVCTSAIECRSLNNEILPISLGDLNISQPDELGYVQVQGRTDTPGALMRMENRGLRGIQAHNPNTVRSVISDSNGFFRFKNIIARGDDELVFQAHDLLGYRSPEAPKHVPDAQVKDVDVLGAYAFGRLVENSPGYLVVRVHPHGVDGRGICPNSTTEAPLCFSGGLTREMVSIDSVLLQKTHALTLEDPEPPFPAGISRDMAIEGNPLAPTQRIVLVMDLSDNASKVDTNPPARFQAAWRFVRTLRARDQLAIVSFGNNTTDNKGVVTDVPFTEIGPNLPFFQEFLTNTMPPMQAMGQSELLKAVETATDMLGGSGLTPGTIVVITMSDQIGDDPMNMDMDADLAYEAVYDKLIGEGDEPLYRLYVVGAQLPATDPSNPQTPSNYNIYVKSLADFSKGRATNVPLVPLIVEPLEKLAGEIGGSYSLLYRILRKEDRNPNLPCTGKDPDIEIQVTVTLPTGVATGNYNGSLTVDAADDPQECP